MFCPHCRNHCLCLSSITWDRFEPFWPNIQLKVYSSSCYVTSASLDSPNKACTPLHILSCDELGSAVCQRSRIFTWYQTQSNHPQRSQTSKVSMNCLEPSKPSIHMQILQTDLQTFAWGGLMVFFGLPCLGINYVTIHKNRNKFHLYLIQLVNGDVVYAQI